MSPNAPYVRHEGTAIGAAGRPVRVLLVEDSPGDVALTVEALREAKIANDLYVVRDGEAAMHFLHRDDDYADCPRPDVILLDLNLPRKDGRQVLEEIRADADLSPIPVVVLTTSTAEADIVRAYQLHATSFISKPVDFGEFVEVVRRFEGFWLQIVRYPPANGRAAAVAAQRGA